MEQNINIDSRKHINRIRSASTRTLLLIKEESRTRSALRNLVAPDQMCVYAVLRRVDQCLSTTSAALSQEDQRRAAYALLGIPHTLPELIGTSKKAVFCNGSALQFVSDEPNQTKDEENAPAYLVCSAGSFSLELNDEVKCYAELCSDKAPELELWRHLATSVDVSGGLSHDTRIEIGCVEGYVEDPAGTSPATLRCNKGNYSIEYNNAVQCQRTL